MARRPYWKGSLKLSLVTCQVALYPATTTAEKTHFHQINTKTKHRLRQQMVDEATGRVVDKQHKGRGYEVSKGKYVEIGEEDLDAIKVESTKVIDLDSFVPNEDIDDRYRDRSYYIAPDGKVGADAFAVIRDAMKDKGRAALGRIVMTNREHVIAIEPYGSLLIGTVLRYPYEIREADEVVGTVRTPKATKDMVKLAEHILETKEAKFDPSKFKDRYETALRALVKRKAAGKTIVAAEEKAEDRDNVIDLMEALQRSVGRRSGKESPSKRTAKKTGKGRVRKRKAA
jgi:DNA end-binding protein Ku